MHLAALTLFQQVPRLIRVDGLILVLIGIKLKKSMLVRRGTKKPNFIKKKKYTAWQQIITLGLLISVTISL